MARSNILSPEQVRHVLLSDETQSSLCRHYGVSRETIRKIRQGRTHIALWPEIPRVATRRAICPDCVHWGEGCTLGIPESKEPGVGQHYAQQCVSFIRPGEDPVPIGDAPP